MYKNKQNLTTVESEPDRYPHLAEYTNFLLESDFLDKVIAHNILIGKEQNIPVLNQLSHLSESEILSRWNEGITNFLKMITQHQGIEYIMGLIGKWKENALEGISKDQLQIEDIISIYLIRKKTLLEFLPKYSTDLSIWKMVLQDSEDFFARAHKLVLEAYDTINREILREKSEILDGILHNLPVIANKITRDGIIEFSEGAGLREIGIEDGENCGKNLFDLQPNASNVKMVLENRVAHTFEGHVDVDGERRKFKNYYFPHENGGVIGFSIDITDQKRAEEELQKKNDQLSQTKQKLKELNKNLEEQVSIRTNELQKVLDKVQEQNEELKKINNDLDNFIYTASHDLKSPILNLQGLIDAFKEVITDGETTPEEQEQILSRIENSIVRIKNTIQGLTEISRAQKDIQGQTTREDVDFNEILNDVLESVSELIESNGATIQKDLGSCKSISFSRGSLKSILYNLISNALKYHSPDRSPLIKVKCEKNGGYYLLEVSDNGLGISKQQRRKIFDMFKRAHDHIEGTGIGLYIIKRIVDNTNGKIEVESEVGKGSTFKVYLKPIQ